MSADMAKIRTSIINALMNKYVQAFKDAAPAEQWEMMMNALRSADINEKQRFIDKIANQDRSGVGAAFINGMMRPYLRTLAAVEADEKLSDGTISLDEYERIHG